MYFTAAIGNPLVALCAAMDRNTAAALAAVRRRAAAWRQDRERHTLAHATRIALSQLDDRMLHDLGLHRSEIASVGEQLLHNADRRRF